jgi:hypothetical protein
MLQFSTTTEDSHVKPLWPARGLPARAGRTDCRVVADDSATWSSVFIQLHLDTRPVKDMRVRSNVDVVCVSPEHTAIPHRRPVLHVHPAHHGRGGGDERINGRVWCLVKHRQQRLVAVVCANTHNESLPAPRTQHGRARPAAGAADSAV